jgi:hypothetical protein
MSLLTMLQDAAIKIGIAKPSTIIGNVDREVSELLAFAQEEGKWLSRRADWQTLNKEQTFTTTAAETQTGAIPSDFDRFINETFWNRSRVLKLTGPLSPQEWQNVKACTTAPITNCFRYSGSNILINPVPAAEETIAYEYISKNFCQSSGGTGQSTWQADADTGVLNELTMGLGVIVRFKISKGLPYDEDLAKYEAFVASDIMAEKPRATSDMSGEMVAKQPGVGVPGGYWGVT